MTFASELSSITRKPVTLVVMTLDICSNVCGVSPCHALAGGAVLMEDEGDILLETGDTLLTEEISTGEKCYNTYVTCKDKANYARSTKDYRLTSSNAPLPFLGPRPYVEGVDYYPTEIKTSLTVRNRVKIKCSDEPDTDVGIDPYLSSRSSTQGTFWKKLLARNPNYKGRPIKIYDGFIGIAEGDFVQRFSGVLDNITIDGELGVTLEAIDLLKKLSEVTIPVKSSEKLVADINDSAVTLTLNDTDDLPSSGYIRISDEIIQYDAKNDTTNQLTGLTRGAFSTTAAEHNNKDKIQICQYFAADNPYEHLQTILSLAGVDATDIDSTAFDNLKTTPYADIDYTAVISEPTKADELYFELIDLLDCRTWVSEDLKITICKNLPNAPSRSYTSISDDENICAESGAVDLNAASRVSRVYLYWDLPTLGDIDTITDYLRCDMAVDADAEGDNEYDEVADLELYCRWFNSSSETEEVLDLYVQNLVERRLTLYRDPLHLITLSLEMKDSGIKTGGYSRLTTDIVNDVSGSPMTSERHQVVKREYKGGTVEIVLQKHAKMIAYVGDNATMETDYNTADEDEREYGCYICDSAGFLPDGRPGAMIF